MAKKSARHKTPHCTTTCYEYVTYITQFYACVRTKTVSILPASTKTCFKLITVVLCPHQKLDK